MVFLRMFDRIVGLISTLVLARLLVPEDFGLVAMAMSVIALVELATAFGFDVVLIQKANPERHHFDTAWTLTIALYCGCAALIALLAVPAAAFYKDPRLVDLMLVIAVAWGLRGFENIGTVEFRRKMDFTKEFIFFAIQRLVGFAVTIAASIAFRTYWALIIGMLASRVTSLALSYIMASYRPRFSVSAARELLSFSKWFLVNNATLVGVVRFPHFLIGRVLGAQQLGVYTVAYDLATLPATELSSPVNRAALPGYSRMTDDKLRFKETFLDIGALVTLIALPASAGMAVVADPLVRLLLGDKWLDAVPVISILSISAAFVAATGNNGVAHLALGRPSLVTLQSFLRLVVLVVLGLALVPSYGIVGASIAELCGALVCLLTSYPFVFRYLEISFVEYWARIWRAVVSTAVMAAVVWAIERSLAAAGDTASALFALFAGVSVGAATYAVIALSLWWVCGKPNGAEKILLNKFLTLVRPRPA